MTQRLIPMLFGVLPISFAVISCEKKPPGSKIPPGNNLVYAHVHGHNGGTADKYGIYTNSDSGSSESPVIESKTVLFRHPNWGKEDKIYFLSGYNGETRAQVYSIDFNGTNIQRLSKDTLAQYSDLDFSTVNERFLYRKTKAGIIQLCSNNLDMDDEKVLLSGDAVGSWNPNGQNIVYVYSEPNSSGGNVMNIYLMNADGSGKTKITSNTAATYLTPYISHNGSKIVYTSTRERQVGNTTYQSTLTDVYTSNIDGSNEQRITNSVPQSDFWYNANWARDSKRVLVIYLKLRMPYTLSILNTADNHMKQASFSWYPIDAKIR